MNFFSNYQEFYEKPLIPIPKNERHLFEQGIFKSDDATYTHWLFALIGEPKEACCQVFRWKVAIYPSTENRHINFNLPFYVSTVFHSFHDAESFCKTLEEKAKQHSLLAELDKKNKKMA